MIFINYYFKTFSQPLFLKRLQGSFFDIHNSLSAISETLQTKPSVVSFCVSEAENRNKILAKRIRNFTEVFC